jgi:hypothetical protein
VLAYLFWHRAAEGTSPEHYEDAQRRLHHSLAARPPAGYGGSARFRAEELPWLDGDGRGYEDWYLVEDWTALGILREAAVAAGHRSAHDAAARHYGTGAGAVMRLAEGHWAPETARVAVWVTPAPGRVEAAQESLLLGDGLDRAHASLWRRELVLGPAPEYCVLAPEPPAGVGEGRLPAGWRARRDARVMLSGG